MLFSRQVIAHNGKDTSQQSIDKSVKGRNSLRGKEI